jgi:PmbA protein
MKEQNLDLLQLAEEMVKYGLKQGADQIEISVDEYKEFSVDIREHNIEKLVEAGSRGLAFRVIKDHRVAAASSTDLSKEVIVHLIDNAVERARISSQDEFAVLPDIEDITVDSNELKIYDPEIAGLSVDEKIKTARKIEEICLADKRIKKSFGSNYESFEGSTFLANSNGFSGSYSKTSVGCSVYLQAGDGDNLIEEGWDDFSRNLKNLKSPEEIATKAIDRVTRLIGARKVETQNVPVVFEFPMTGTILRFLYDCIRGRNIYMKQSFLADKLGKKIGSDIINVIDDGLLHGAAGTKPFDGEGVPVRKTIVVENGILKNFLLNTYSAGKLGLKSTGNASGVNNLYLKPGETSPEDIIRSVKKGLLLTDTIGFGFVSATGDISQGAFGLWIENGEIAYPVAEITISGNLGQILNDIEMIGNDLEFKRRISGPTIKVGEMTVGGR